MNRFNWNFSILVDLAIDSKFIAILPAINVNLHSMDLEFEWLIFALYIGKHGTR